MKIRVHTREQCDNNPKLVDYTNGYTPMWGSPSYNVHMLKTLCSETFLVAYEYSGSENVYVVDNDNKNYVFKFACDILEA